MASGRLADYLGKGDAADRPASLDLHPEAVGFYYATDTEAWSAWDGSQWVPVVAGGVPAADEVTYDNAASGLSAADVQAAIDELAQDSGGIPDAPSDGKLYGRKDATWEEVPSGGGGIPDAPADGTLYGRKDETWVEVPAGGRLPVGGDPGQVLAKASADDFDAEWVDPSGGGGSGVTSPTISRIITSTDPDEPLSPGDLLVVLPRPRVIAAAHSPQTYGDGDSVTSVTVTVPLEAKEGDMLLLLVSSADTVATPGGFSLVRTQDSVRDVSSGGLGRTTVFSMNAGSDPAGSTITVAQGSSGRMAAVLVVARGAGISIADSGSEQFSESTNPEFPHPIPSLTATAQGQMAVCAMSCALAHLSGNTDVVWPTGWVAFTPTSAPDSPSHERMRSWAAYRYLQAGESTEGACLHSVGNHDGSSITVILECA